MPTFTNCLRTICTICCDELDQLTTLRPKGSGAKLILGVLGLSGFAQENDRDRNESSITLSRNRPTIG
jgi:hypothetical protein